MPGVPWDHIAVNAWRSDRVEQIRQARAMGATPWLYGGPEKFSPANWRASLAHIEAESDLHGGIGIIPDPENEWPEHPDRVNQARAFGAALADAATRRRVGVTTYPSFPVRRELTAAAGPGVWWAVQLLGRSSVLAPVLANWLDNWRALVGARATIVVGGWVASTPMGTEAGYRRYLSAVPRTGGAWVWDAAGAGRPYIAPALTAYRDTLSPIDGAMGTLGALVVQPAVTVVLVLALIAAALGAAWYYRG